MKTTTKEIQKELGDLRFTIINSVSKKEVGIESPTLHDKKRHILSSDNYKKLHPSYYLLVKKRVSELQTLKAEQFPANSYAYSILKKYGK